LKRSIKSTLCSSGIFQKIDEDKKLWFYKQEEAMDYLKRNAEKVRGREVPRRIDVTSSSPSDELQPAPKNSFDKMFLKKK
jgi:hypothetical protein